jgi:hypothetical protein
VTAGRRAILLLAITCGSLAGWGWPPLAHADVPPTSRRAVLIVTDPVSFADFMAQPQSRMLARAGGAGLLSAPDSIRDSRARMLRALLAGGSTADEDRNLLIRTVRAAGIPVCVSTSATPTFCAGPGLAVLAPPGIGGRQTVTPPAAPSSTMIIQVAVQPTAAMTASGDQLMPIVMAEGRGPGGPTARAGPMHSLTSDTTRYPGLVAVGDVAPTLLEYLGVPVPSSMTGSPIRVTGHAAPFALYQRQLEQRRIRVPVQLAELAFVCLAGVALIILMIGIERGRNPSSSAAAACRFLALCGVAMFVPVAAGGLLPHLTAPWVVVWIVGWTLLLAWAAGRVPWRGTMSPLTFLGAVALAYLAVDLALGSRGLRVPLLGGVMFAGSRYYGLPNAFESTLLASGLFVAARFDPVRGAALLFACGLLAGFPGLGADVGGSIALFTATGLWWQLRTRGRLGIRELGVTAAVVVAGLAVVLVANRLLAPSPTHVTRFVETSGSSLTSGLHVVGQRLAAGFRQVADSPASLIPLIGLPIVLWAGLRDGPLARALAATRPWREVLIVLIVAAGVAFFVNDTGMAAAAPAFLYAVVVLALPVLTPRVAPPAAAEAAASSMHAR